MQTVVQTTSAHQVPHEVRIFPETPPRIPHGQETAKEGQEEEGQEEEEQEEQEQATREVAVMWSNRDSDGAVWTISCHWGSHVASFW